MEPNNLVSNRNLPKLNAILNDFNKSYECQTIYHYTSFNSMYKILNGGTLRLFNISDLNDPIELEYGINVIKNYYEKKYDKSKIFEKLNENIKMFGVFKQHIYVISFSKCKDDLGMWGFYGDRCNGISLGFDKDSLWNQIILKNDEKLPCYLFPIQYLNIDGSYELQNEKLKINFFLEKLTEFLYEIKDNEKDFINTCLFFSSLIKTSFWEKEEEIRLAFFVSTPNYINWCPNSEKFYYDLNLKKHNYTREDSFVILESLQEDIETIEKETQEHFSKLFKEIITGPSINKMKIEKIKIMLREYIKESQIETIVSSSRGQVLN